jgi:hypothetical protein
MRPTEPRRHGFRLGFASRDPFRLVFPMALKSLKLKGLNDGNFKKACNSFGMRGLS